MTCVTPWPHARCGGSGALLLVAVLACAGLLACSIPADVPASARDPNARTPASGLSSEPAAEAGAGPTSGDRRDLGADESRGGHTLERHVGLSDNALRDCLRRERRISAASTWTDRATAERVVALAIAQAASRIERWQARSGARPNLALDYEGDGTPIWTLPAPRPAAAARV